MSETEMVVANIVGEFTDPVRDAESAVAQIVVADEDAKNPPVLLAAINEATPVLQYINGIKKKAEARRTELVKPLNDHVKKINQAAKDVMAPILAAEAVLKSRVLKWQGTIREIEAEQLRKQRAEEERQRKLREQAEAKGEEIKPAVKPIPVPIPILPQSSAKTRKQWTYEVKDFSQIPRDYLNIDHNVIMNAIHSGVREIAGIEIFQKDVLITG